MKFGDIPSSGDWPDSSPAIRSAGKSIVATAESRSNASFGLMTTPDQVAGIVLPTDGLIAVAFEGLWKESVLNNAAAAIFLGSNQLKVVKESTSDTPLQETNAPGGTANRYTALFTTGVGLQTATASSTDQANVTTGQIIGTSDGLYGGGCILLFAAAGTYTVSVQFKVFTGSVTAKERKLWVWSMAF